MKEDGAGPGRGRGSAPRGHRPASRGAGAGGLVTGVIWAGTKGGRERVERAVGAQVRHPGVRADWWEQRYKVTADWQTANGEPEACVDLKEADLGEAAM